MRRRSRYNAEKESFTRSRQLGLTVIEYGRLSHRREDILAALGEGSNFSELELTLSGRLNFVVVDSVPLFVTDSGTFPLTHEAISTLLEEPLVRTFMTRLKAVNHINSKEKKKNNRPGAMFVSGQTYVFVGHWLGRPNIAIRRGVEREATDGIIPTKPGVNLHKHEYEKLQDELLCLMDDEPYYECWLSPRRKLTALEGFICIEAVQDGKTMGHQNHIILNRNGRRVLNGVEMQERVERELSQLGQKKKGEGNNNNNNKTTTSSSSGGGGITTSTTTTTTTNSNINRLGGAAAAAAVPLGTSLESLVGEKRLRMTDDEEDLFFSPTPPGTPPAPKKPVKRWRMM